MTHAIDVAFLVNTLGAVLYIVLGVWVLTLAPRRRQTTLLGTFAILFGLTWGLPNSLETLHLAGVAGMLALHLPLRLGSLGLALGLAWNVPDPLEERRVMAIGFGVGAGIPFAWLSNAFLWGPWAGFSVLTRSAAVVNTIGFALLFSAVVIMALRAHPGRGMSRGRVRQLAILCLAFATFFAFDRGMEAPHLARALATGAFVDQFFTAWELLPWLVLTGFWLWNMILADETTIGIHRGVALGILGLMAAGSLYQAAVPTADPGSTFMRGVMRTLGVALLAYGVLRHDLAGLDAKVEWTVSKTTVAGVFIAVFFVVSEGAQALFADFAGNELVGVLAAGALVFVISPIQRMADRFAAKAVPGGDGIDASQAEAAYRGAVEAALADGVISDDEERHLAEKVEALGLAPTRAYEIRREVEEELVAGGDT